MAKYKVRIDSKEYEVTVTDSALGARVTVEGSTFDVEPAAGAAPPPPASGPALAPVAAMPAAPAAAPAPGGSGSITAPIPGVVTQLCVKAGEAVAANQVVLKLEAMKMENDICTPVAGTVTDIAISEGAEVRDGELLMVIE